MFVYIKRCNAVVAFFLSVIYSTRAAQNTPHIVGGTDVSPDANERNWVVSLQLDSSHFCGGSLIAPNWVLTAAHCVYEIDDITVVGGMVNLTNITRVESEIKRVIRHEAYDKKSYFNDIALLELKSPMVELSSIKLIDREEQQAPESWVYSAGWGATSQSGPEPEVLQKVRLPIVSYTKCTAKGSYKKDQLFEGGTICAGYDQGGMDSCQGDSGGPLYSVDPETDNMNLVGVVSWGDGCAQPKKYGVYTRVNFYLDWIRNYTGITQGPTTNRPSSRPTTQKPSRKPTRRGKKNV